MLIVNHLEKEYGLLSVLREVSFSVGRGQKMALIGNNGSGKSTLLKILAGLEKEDRGFIRFDPDAKIGYVPQDLLLPQDKTIEDFFYEGYLEHDGVFDQQINALLKGFGFESTDRKMALSVLSGGQRRKVCLIKLFLDGSNLFLLDEPTNDLDLPAILCLERLLMNSDVTVIVASHDRRFLDRVARKILEIDDVSHTASVTNGLYSEYLIASTKKRERLFVQYAEQQDEIERLKNRAKELKRRNQKGNIWEGSDNDTLLRGFKRNRSIRSGKRAKAIEKRIDQMDEIEKPFERKPLELLLSNNTKQGNRDILLEQVVAGYPNTFQMQPYTFYLPFGKRVCFVGLNGVGKSTLLKTMTGGLVPIQGEVRIGSGVRFGFLTQEHDLLDRTLTPLQVLQLKAGSVPEKAFLLMDIFGIDTRQANDLIDTLSPGTRVRLILAIFYALEVNALILDEPTNHLDIEALMALEEAMESFRGTVILVSHDRMFIENVRMDAIYHLDKSGKVNFVQDYQRYVEDLEYQMKGLLRIC